MYLSIQLAFFGAFKFLTGALIILFLDRILTASAKLESEGISMTGCKFQKEKKKKKKSFFIYIVKFIELLED